MTIEEIAELVNEHKRLKREADKYANAEMNLRVKEASTVDLTIDGSWTMQAPITSVQAIIYTASVWCIERMNEIEQLLNTNQQGE